MSAEALYHGDHNRVDKVATGAIASGEIIQLGDGRVGVYQGLNAAESGDTVSLRTEGVFKILTGEATTFAVGDPVFWDASASLAIAASAALDGSADIYLGPAVFACSNTQTRVQVDINVPIVMEPFVKEIDTTEAAAEYTLIPAWMNPDGLIIDEIIGVISEVMGGGTEDQGIVTVYDSADTSLATLTPTDAGGDAEKDIIVGYALSAATTGDAGLIVPAGLSVYAKTTQLSSGASLAGKMRVVVKARKYPV